MVLEEDEVLEVLASARKQKRQEISKEKCVEGLDDHATRKFRARNRYGNVGHWARECPQKRVQSYKGSGRGGNSARKNEF